MTSYRRGQGGVRDIPLHLWAPPHDSILFFKYLMRVMSGLYEECPAAISNLWKSRKKWDCLSRVLGWEVSEAWSTGGGGGYLALVQFLLLFKSDTWVMYPHIDRTIGGFHHRVVLRLVWNYTRHQEDGIWSYPQLATAMSVAVL